MSKCQKQLVHRRPQATSYLAEHDPTEPEVHVADDGERAQYTRRHSSAFLFWNDGHCHLIHIIGFCRGLHKIIDRGLDFTCFWTHLGCISCWDFADSHGVTTGHSSLAPEGRVCPPWVVPSSKILRRSRNWEESWPKVDAKDGSGWRINKNHERHLN